MKAPEWLAEFPFLTNHWQEIVKLLNSYAELDQFDLESDWQVYIKQHQSNHTTIDWFKALREYRKSRLAFIAYLDLRQPLDMHLETMHLVSALADHLISVAYAVVQAEMLNRHGRVIDGQGEPVDLMVFALGKLGTLELNYSSDVDLVFLYENDGQSDGKRPLAATDYFIRMGQKIIKLLDFFSPDGQVYRVDMRLRPFGSAGPLACSLAALQSYLVQEGRDWERFAWMRARMVCGHSASSVMAVLLPFIYRRHLDYQVFDALAAIKSEISIHTQAETEHIKLGHGGIRVIEFIVQSLQLVFGGRYNHFQGTELYPQINNLLNMKKLDINEARTLRVTWLMLRKVENVVQIVDDQANHTYPKKAAVQQIVSEALQFNDWEQALTKITDCRNHIAHIFEAIFSTDHIDEETNLKQQQMSQKLLESLPLSRMPQKRAEQIKQLVAAAVAKTSDDLALVRFIEMVKKIVTRPAYILMLLKEPNLLSAVLELIGKQAYFAQVLQQHPVLLEQLFEYETFVGFNEMGLLQKWNLQHKEETDVELWMESVRHFKNVGQFNLMMAWSNGEVSDSKACQQLTVLAKFLLRQVVSFTYADLVSKYQGTKIKINDLIVVAYGSAATDEMTVDSDLDLVFVLDVKELNSQDRVFAQKWIKRIMHHLSSHMYNGKLYDLDMQLRPNGNSGTLITTCDEFSRYQRQSAWVWEHVAMIKSKAIFGSEHQMEWHQMLRKEVLTQARNNDEVDKALAEMATKLSESNPEKNHQAEFQVLGTVLKNTLNHPQLLSHCSIHKLQQHLLKLGLLNQSTIDSKLKRKGPIG